MHRIRTHRLHATTIVAVVAALLSGCVTESLTGSDCSTDGVEGRSAYACMPDLLLLSAIRAADGEVSIGFKEADQRVGVDPRGRVLTTDETAHAMKRLLLARGMTFSWQASRIPAVSGSLPLSAELLRELRRHPNIDYIEPATSASVWAAEP